MAPDRSGRPMSTMSSSGTLSADMMMMMNVVTLVGASNVISEHMQTIVKTVEKQEDAFHQKVIVRSRGTDRYIKLEKLLPL